VAWRSYGPRRQEPRRPTPASGTRDGGRSGHLLDDSDRFLGQGAIHTGFAQSVLLHQDLDADTWRATLRLGRVSLFAAPKRGLHFFERREIFLEPVDMLLPLHDSRPELLHRAECATHTWDLRLGRPLTHPHCCAVSCAVPTAGEAECALRATQTSGALDGR
jgi:hypothetical protein